MERGYRYKSWFVGTTCGIVLALILWPATRWMVQTQSGLILPHPSAVAPYEAFGIAPSGGDITELRHQAEASAAKFPDDYAMQLALAVSQQPEEKNRLAVLQRIRAAGARFTDSPVPYANQLRLAPQFAVRISRPENGGLPGQPDKTPPEQPGAESNLPEQLALFDHDAAAGERLDPDNAYFPFMRAVGLFAAKRDSEALQALHRAAQKSRWEEYYAAEMQGMEHLYTETFSEPGALVRTMFAARLLFPHYSALRNASRVALYKAAEAEQAQHFVEGDAIRTDLLQCGSLMRVQARTLIGNLVGVAITQLAIASPEGVPALQESEQNPADKVRKSLATYEEYLKRIHLADRIPPVRAEIAAGEKAQMLARRIAEASPFGKPIMQLCIFWAACLVLLCSAFWMLFATGVAALAARSIRVREGHPLPADVANGLGFGLAAGITSAIALLSPDLSQAVAGLLIGLVVTLTLLFVLFVAKSAANRTRGTAVFARSILSVIAVGILLRWQMQEGIGSYLTLFQGFFSLSAGEGGSAPASDRTVALLLATLVVCAVPVFSMVVLGILSRIWRVPLSVGVSRGLKATGVPIACILLLLYSGLVVITLRQERVIHAGLVRTMEHEGRYLSELTGEGWPE